MSDVVDPFTAELARDPRFAESAQSIRKAIRALDCESDASPDAAGFYECLHWVIGRRDRLLREKIAKIGELMNRRGRVEGRIRDIVRW